MEKRKIDNCYHFDIEIGCTEDFCTCETVEKKQETIEEVAERLYPYALYENDYNALQNRKRIEFIAGARWQAERSYSEEEAGELVYNIIGQYAKQYGIMIDGAKLNDLFEQFKKR